MLRVDTQAEDGTWPPGIDYYWFTHDACTAARRNASKTGRVARVVYPFGAAAVVMHEFGPAVVEKKAITIDMDAARAAIFKGGA